MEEPGTNARTNRRLPVLLAAVGLLSCTLVAVAHLLLAIGGDYDVLCSTGGAFSCASLANAGALSVAGVAWPIWGMLLFLSLLLAAWYRSRWLLPVSGAAALGSLGVLLADLMSDGQLCVLCCLVHLSAWALFATSVSMRRSLEHALRDWRHALNLFAPSAGLLVAAILFLPAYWHVPSWQVPPSLPHGTTEDGQPWIGAPHPELVVHEYTDYACPHCSSASWRMLWLVADNANEVRLVRRQYPRMRCPTGSGTCEAARIAYCAAKQDKFWQMDRWLFEHVQPARKINIEQAAAHLGIEPQPLKTCVDSEEAYEHVDAEAREAIAQRLPGTPAYLVDGSTVTPSELRQMIAR